MSRAPLLGIALAALVCLSGCGGTEAGNPGQTVASATDTASPASGTSSSGNVAPVVTPGLLTQTGQIQSAICTKLNECFPSLSVSGCVSGTNATTGFAAPLGLPSTADTETLGTIIGSEQTGSVTPSAAASSACESDLNAVSCGTAATAYDPSVPANFSNVPTLLPPACRGVY